METNGDGVIWLINILPLKKPMGTIKEPITPSPLNEGGFVHGDAGEI